MEIAKEGEGREAFLIGAPRRLVNNQADNAEATMENLMTDEPSPAGRPGRHQGGAGGRARSGRQLLVTSLQPSSEGRV